MGSCFTKDEEDYNHNLTNLNDSRHVMMKRASLKEGIEVVPTDGSAYRPRGSVLPEKLSKELTESD